ncbi:MAG TPA: substrate-binding domain-containing protein [Terriglobales bacterium]
MKKLKFVVSLTTNDNDYQIEQAAAASESANRLGVDIDLLYAENDAIVQSQQLLKIIQSNADSHPDGIIFEPVGGTALPQVARAAAAAGVAWVILNREVDYLTDLRRNFKVPLFSLSSDHEEIGRIQGRQVAALLPDGGSVLLIQGPGENLAAKQRTTGMYETKTLGVQVKAMKANWTESGAHKAVSSWLKLSTSLPSTLDAIVAQDDSMALGARKAFQESQNTASRDRWLAMPFLGIDGMPKTGLEFVRKGLLAATIIVPTNTGTGIEMLATALRTGKYPPEKTLISAKSFPPIEELARKRSQKGHASGKE